MRKKIEQQEILIGRLEAEKAGFLEEREVRDRTIEDQKFRLAQIEQKLDAHLPEIEKIEELKEEIQKKIGEIEG